MVACGCHRIGGYINDQPSSRSSLTTGGVEPSDTSEFLLYDFGFEVSSSTARLLDKEDPESWGELWPDYEPSTRRLDLGTWGEPFAHAVDWDIHQDTGPCSATEVQRRL